MSTENSEIAKRIMELTTTLLNPTPEDIIENRGHRRGLNEAASIAAAHESALVRELEAARVDSRRYRRSYDSESTIVARIWQQLGSPSYEALKGRSIYDLIAELKADRAKLAELEADNGRLREAGNKLAESCAATYTSTFNNTTWKQRACCHTHPNAPHDQSCGVTAWNTATNTARALSAPANAKANGGAL